MNRKSSTPIDDDRLTPEDERSLAFGVSQGKAGLTYGPFEKGGLSLRAFIKARERTRRVSIRIPAALLEYLQTEAKRFGMRPGELMSCILQIHQFKDRDRQLILLAVDPAASTKRKNSKSKSKKL
jgi:hypothetical protein